VRSLTGVVQRVVERPRRRRAVTAGLAREVLEGAPRRGVRRAPDQRIVVSSAGGVRSREKMVWTGHGRDRVIEDLR